MSIKKISYIVFVLMACFFGLNVANALNCAYDISDSNGTNDDKYNYNNVVEFSLKGNSWDHVGTEYEDCSIFISKRDGCPETLYFANDIFSDRKSVIENTAPQGGITEFQLVDISGKVACGNVTGIPRKFPELTSYAIKVIQVAVPIILVILGSIDLFKGITAQKEDEIKKGQQMLVKRIIVAAVIFFVVLIVKFFVSLVADSNTVNVVDCIDCFINNDCNI